MGSLRSLALNNLDKNVNESTTKCSLRSLHSLALNYMLVRVSGFSLVWGSLHCSPDFTEMPILHNSICFKVLFQFCGHVVEFLVHLQWRCFQERGEKRRCKLAYHLGHTHDKVLFPESCSCHLCSCSAQGTSWLLLPITGLYEWLYFSVP